MFVFCFVFGSLHCPCIFKKKRFDQPDDDIKNKKVEDAVLSSLSTQRRRDGNAGNTGSRNRNSNSNNNWNDKDCVQIQQPLVGTSTAIEKSYLRLTTAPKSCEVRPLIVLQKSLVHIKAHYVQHDDFEYANEQLKSIRQDITVQHLRNEFVLNVYETHARICTYFLVWLGFFAGICIYINYKTTSFSSSRV